MMIKWPAPAKLNLFLYINHQYPNGYHHLQTLFQFLEYGDTINLILNKSGKISLQDHLIDGTTPEKNLMMIAAKLLHEKAIKCGLLPTDFGVEIKLIKRLPLGGGLGGGSSNAATILIALNYLWKTNFSLDELGILGLQIGTDVPVFIHGHAAFAEGLGEKLQPVMLPERWYLIVCPAIIIPTSLIFKDTELKRNTPPRKLTELLHRPFNNDCEALVRKKFLEVEQLFGWLLKYAPASLTGTGACIFAEFENEFKARQVLEIVPKGVRGFVTRSVNLSPLHRLIFKGISV
ncbi:MAG: 4-(cytidine 5'-diphospho)-2-C-methyl-D-erythritol kinase [Candidatus Dasytiphilus stammeri]